MKDDERAVPDAALHSRHAVAAPCRRRRLAVSALVPRPLHCLPFRSLSLSLSLSHSLSLSLFRQSWKYPPKFTVFYSIADGWKNKPRRRLHKEEEKWVISVKYCYSQSNHDKIYISYRRQEVIRASRSSSLLLKMISQVKSMNLVQAPNAFPTDRALLLHSERALDALVTKHVPE